MATGLDDDLRRWMVLPLYSTKVRHVKTLTRQIWHGLQLLHPCLRNLHGGFLLDVADWTVAVLIGGVDELGNILRIDGVEDVVEVRSIWQRTLLMTIREVASEEWIILEEL